VRPKVIRFLKRGDFFFLSYTDVGLIRAILFDVSKNWTDLTRSGQFQGQNVSNYQAKSTTQKS
jgi:hypothetical protein